MPFLTEPSAQYKDEFIESVREFQREGKQLYYDIEHLRNDFAGFLQQLRDQQNGTYDRVPATEFWLIDDGRYIGRLSVRHELNGFLLKVGGNIGYEIRPSKRKQGYGTQMLRLGLEKARQLGLCRALVTCDENNIGSKKVIERNGGKFENAVDVEGASVKKLRYWIDLAEK